MSNLFAILEFEATKNIAKLRKPVEKEIWGIPPAQVNAFYNPNKNDIGKSIVHCCTLEIQTIFLESIPMVARFTNFSCL